MINELCEVVGVSTTIFFDKPFWSLLQGGQGKTLVEAAVDSRYAGRPLMVEVGVGDDSILYTSLHQHAQISGRESVLLQLLVMKQISTQLNTTIAHTSQSLGISLKSLALRHDADCTFRSPHAEVQRGKGITANPDSEES
jgi:hypothetical protein